MNKAQLIETLAGRLDLPRAEAARAVDALFGPDGIVAETLRAGDRVQITGFGTFQTRKRAARTGRNPRTGKPIEIKAAKLPVFRPGEALRQALL